MRSTIDVWLSTPTAEQTVLLSNVLSRLRLISPLRDEIK